MCGRFNLLSDEDEQEMRAIVEAIDRRYNGKPELALMARKEVYPTNIVPVIANNKRLEPKAFLMKWGFAHFSGTGVIINTRSETAMDKPMFRKSLMERRCVIPASNYYEWDRSGAQKIKYAIRTKGQRMIYMAGIYRLEENSPLPVFSILTREGTPDVAFHPRMPLILPPQDIEQWLQPNARIEQVMSTAQTHMDCIAI